MHGPLEATYVIKIMTGDLRIGLREGLVVDAVAAAFERDTLAVRRAADRRGRLGRRRPAAKHDTLADVALAYHAPLAFMLASPIPYGSAYKDLAAGTWLVEDKYDGVRIQAHVTAQRVSLFSRTLNDVATAFPEIAAALRELTAACILDGEIVAQRDGRVLPFRYLQARLQRKVVAADLQAEIPVRFIAFDVLARNDDVLLDRTLEERRGALAEVLAGIREPIVAAPWTALESGSTPEAVHERFEIARSRRERRARFQANRRAVRAGPARQMVAQTQTRTLDARRRRRRGRMGTRQTRAGPVRLHLCRPRRRRTNC